MDEVKALEMAKRVAAEKGWEWKPPFVVSREQDEEGRWCWEVSSNCEAMGANVDVTIEEATGEVTEAVFNEE